MEGVGKPKGATRDPSLHLLDSSREGMHGGQADVKATHAIEFLTFSTLVMNDRTLFLGSESKQSDTC